MEEDEDTPIALTVLLAGDGERLADALVDALGRRGVTIDRVSRAKLVQRAYVTAPDLIVLVGDATEDLGREPVAELAAKRATSSIPIAVVVEDRGELSDRLDAFKHGVVSMIPRSASADEMASRIAEVLREVPDRSGEVHRGLAEASVDELVELFAQELRSGILSVAAGPDDVSAQVVLHADRPVQEVVGELVERLRPLVSRAEGPLRYEFFESAADRLGALAEELVEDADLDVFDGLRMVLVEQRAARSDALVQELRGNGAQVVVADGAGAGLDRAVSLDPQVVVFDGKGERGWALGALRRVRRDPRLRWASVLVVDEAQLWREGEGDPDLRGLAAAIRPLVEPDLELKQRALEETAFDVRLEALGPSRLLRTLAQTGGGLRLRVTSPAVVAEVDVADGLVAGAMARLAGGPLKAARGPAAIATFLALSSGRVRVEHRDAPARADVMAPVDAALAAAEGEASLIAPSIPPPSHPPAGAGAGSPPSVPSGKADAAMVTRLESLIDQLSDLVERGESLRPGGSASSAEPIVFPRPARLPHKAKIPAAIPPAKLPAAPPPPKKGLMSPRSAQGSAKAPPRRPRRKATLAGVGAPSAPIEPPARVEASVEAPEPSEAPRPATPSAAPSAAALEAASASAFASVPPPDEAEPAPSPDLDPFDVVPDAPEAAPPLAPPELDEPELPKSRLPVALAIGVVLILLAGGGGWLGWTYLRDDPSSDESPPPTASEPPTVPEPGEPEAPEEAETPEEPEEPEEVAEATEEPEEPEAADPGAVYTPLAESDPLEGSGDDFSLAALGIEPVEESSRRRRRQLLRELIRRGNIHRNRGQLQQAEELYRRMLALDPENPRATVGMCRIAMRREQGGLAVLFAQRLVRLRPAFASNWVLLGDAFEAAGDDRAALRAWTHAHDIEPRWAPARERLARVDGEAEGG